MRPSVLAALTALSVSFAAPAVAAPNLELVSVESPADALVGGTVHVSFVAGVRGSPLPSFRWAVGLSVDGVAQGSQRLGVMGPVTPTVEGRITVEGDVAVPATLAPGAYFLVISLDPGELVAESNELDNSSVTSGRVHLSTPLPNLVVEAVAPAQRRRGPGEALDVDVIFKNDGTVDATVELSVHLSDDEVVTTVDPSTGRAVVTVPRGQRLTRRITGPVPASLASGEYLVGAILDGGQASVEANELDNLALAGDPLTVSRDTLSLVTAELPGGTVFIPYFAKLSASGGDGSYRFAVVAGGLPEGLRLAGATGELTGVPLASGPAEVDIEVRSGPLVDVARFSLTIAESGLELAIVTPGLEGATLGLPYQSALVAAGGEPPYRWTIVSGALPPGLDLGGDGALRGVPTKEGEFSFAVAVTDALGGRITGELSMPVAAPNVVVLSAAAPALPVGEPASVTLEATGGKPPYVWEALSVPPPGLTLSEDGHLSGVPGRVGRYTMRVRATDASRVKRSDTALLHVTVEDAGTFVIVTQKIPALALRQRLDLPIEVEGGQPPFIWKLHGVLPSGFAFEVNDTGDAKITGSSVRGVVQPFGLLLEDALGRQRSVALALQVNDFQRGPVASGCRCVAPAGGVQHLTLGVLAVLGLVVVRRSRPRQSVS